MLGLLHLQCNCVPSYRLHVTVGWAARALDAICPSSRSAARLPTPSRTGPSAGLCSASTRRSGTIRLTTSPVSWRKTALNYFHFILRIICMDLPFCLSNCCCIWINQIKQIHVDAKKILFEICTWDLHKDLKKYCFASFIFCFIKPASGSTTVTSYFVT